MIYTRFGTPVKILGADKDDKGIWVKVKRPDGSTREFSVNELIATGGIKEINEAIHLVSGGVVSLTGHSIV